MRRQLVVVAVIAVLMAGAASAFVAVTGTVALRVREPLSITNAHIQTPRFFSQCTIADDRLSTACSADQFAGESGTVRIALANQGSVPIAVHLAATTSSSDVTLSILSPGPDRTVAPQGPGQPPVEFQISVSVSQGAAPGMVTITAQFIRETPTPTPTPTPPANDSFVNAIALSVPATVNGDNAGASLEAGEPPCFGISATVWYRITPGTSGTLTATTVGGITNFDTVLALYQGTALDNLSLLECNDQFVGGDQSQVTGTVTAGLTYYVQLGGFFGDTGDFTLGVTISTPTPTPTPTPEPTPTPTPEPTPTPTPEPTPTPTPEPTPAPTPEPTPTSTPEPTPTPTPEPTPTPTPEPTPTPTPEPTTTP